MFQYVSIIFIIYHNVLVTLMRVFFSFAGPWATVTFHGLLHFTATKIAVKCNVFHLTAIYISRLYTITIVALWQLYTWNAGLHHIGLYLH